ncbi:PREDICTED: endogenous retrovirus group K member 6 Gag polyprotein-like [Miniopterus natalensis]|uniref:endogenous retrovirus group K member 6 Gag polyprotein-like n=1 Tax=Miniopterus natalensis TaxID=291302 RepID=UPI0007A6A7D9|nr:PREDICTED: endogenous retrovirus group K member 6 Gag polyprotein-like [Miniopterus natalensis]
MGQENSKVLFAQVLKTMLRSRGAKVSTAQLRNFLQFVEEVCPWFPEEGTVNLETWNKVGRRMQGFFQAHGPQKVPVEAFSLWTLVRDCLDPRHEGVRMGASSEATPVEAPGASYAEGEASAPPIQLLTVKPERLNPKEEQDLDEAAAAYEKEKYGEFVFLSEECADKHNPLPPDPTMEGLWKQMQALMSQVQDLHKSVKGKDAEGSQGQPSAHPKGADPLLIDLEEDPPGYPGEKPTVSTLSAGPGIGMPIGVRVLDPQERTMIALAQKGPGQARDPGWGRVRTDFAPMSSFQMALSQARLRGEDLEGFDSESAMCYPVFEQPAQGNNSPQRVYGPMDFKKLKELKMACAQYGPTAPYTEAILEALDTEYTMCPNDWKQLARACLSGGDYLLWKSEYTEQCEKVHRLNVRNNIPSDLQGLLGEGQFADTPAQLQFGMGTYAQISAAARKAWKKLPNTKNVTMDLTKIRQGPDELYQDFVSRLLDAAGKLIGDGEAGVIIVRQLAFENANTACQAALRPYRHKGSLNDYIRLCQDIGPSYTTGVTLAAALRGQTMQQFLQQQGAGRGRGRRVPGPPGSCFSCGQLGHFTRNCPQKPSSNQRAPAGPPRGASPGLCPRCKKGNHWARDCKSKLDLQGRPLSLPLQSGNWQRGQPQAPQTYGALKGEPQGQTPGSNPFVTSSEPPQGAPDWTSVPPPTQY